MKSELRIYDAALFTWWFLSIFGEGFAMSKDFGYLQHGMGTEGPFRTERVLVKNEYADKWLAFFEGKWRRVHIQVRSTFIVFQGDKITIQIEGV